MSSHYYKRVFSDIFKKTEKDTFLLKSIKAKEPIILLIIYIIILLNFRANKSTEPLNSARNTFIINNISNVKKFKFIFVIGLYSKFPMAIKPKAVKLLNNTRSRVSGSALIKKRNNK